MYKKVCNLLAMTFMVGVLQGMSLDKKKVVLQQTKDLVRLIDNAKYSKNDRDKIRSLIEAKADVKAVFNCDNVEKCLTRTDRWGKPLLHVAVANDDMEVVEMLIKAGADQNACDGSNLIALFKAQNREMAEYLIAQGAQFPDRFFGAALAYVASEEVRHLILDLHGKQFKDEDDEKAATCTHQ